MSIRRDHLKMAIIAMEEQIQRIDTLATILRLSPGLRDLPNGLHERDIETLGGILNDAAASLKEAWLTAADKVRGV